MNKDYKNGIIMFRYTGDIDIENIFRRIINMYGVSMVDNSVIYILTIDISEDIKDVLLNKRKDELKYYLRLNKLKKLFNKKTTIIVEFLEFWYDNIDELYFLKT